MLKTLTLLLAVGALVACGDKADEADPGAATPASKTNPADKAPPAKTDGGETAAATKTVTLQIDGMT